MTAITTAPVQARVADRREAGDRAPAEKDAGDGRAGAGRQAEAGEKPVQKPIEKSTTKKPSTGPEIKSGAARVVTPNAAQVPFGGLAERAGGSSTGGLRLDVANFCCPDYIETMNRRIRSNWDQQQGAAGQTVVKFTIRRDGMLTNVEVEKASGNPLLDLESRKAVLTTRQLPPLPDRVRSADVDRVPDLRLQALMRPMKLLTILFRCEHRARRGRAESTRAAIAAAGRQSAARIGVRPRSPAEAGGARVHPAQQGRRKC